jgi:hypothetical protein
VQQMDKPILHQFFLNKAGVLQLIKIEIEINTY